MNSKNTEMRNVFIASLCQLCHSEVSEIIPTMFIKQLTNTGKTVVEFECTEQTFVFRQNYAIH